MSFQPLPLEYPDHVGCEALLALEGHVAPYKVLHVAFERVDYTVGYGDVACEAAVISPRHGMDDVKPGAGIACAYCTVEHHAQRAYVDSGARRAFDGQIFYLLGRVDLIVKGFGLVVDTCAYRGETYARADAGEYCGEILTTFYRYVFTYVGAIYLECVAHNLI